MALLTEAARDAATSVRHSAMDDLGLCALTEAAIGTMDTQTPLYDFLAAQPGGWVQATPSSCFWGLLPMCCSRLL